MIRLATLTALVGIILVEVLGLPFAAAQPNDISILEEQAMQAAVARVADSVVKIETVGGLEKVGSVLIGTGPTTGLVVDADGYIISSTYNFIQKPTSILVTLSNGKKAAAEIVTRDNSRKLVLLKVNTDKKLKVPTAVPADEVEIGQWAIAVGRTFGGDFPNLSVGIISAKNRIWGRALQADSKISPANYGGPLVDIRGRVFGVLAPQSPQNGSDAGGAEWYDSGIGFAIPLEDVFAVLERLKAGEELYRGLLGISLKGKNDMSDAPIIAAAPAGTPAAKAGIKNGDQVVSVNGTAVQTQSQLKMALGRFYAGDEIALRLKRGDEQIDTKATLTDKVEPYQLPCLGILPMRTAAENAAGVKVRYVYPDSSADKAGIKVGDTLQKLNKEELATAEAWRESLAAIDLEEAIKVELDRDGKTVAVT
ncbi:MAG: PDZ domain-containing protein [Planctomycetota bacterium]